MYATDTEPAAPRLHAATLLALWLVWLLAGQVAGSPWHELWSALSIMCALLLAARPFLRLLRRLRWLLLAILLTFALGQLISNTATALIVIPIAVSAAAELDVSAKPVLMAICVASAASFITPVATPANLMVMEPGGYRFGDYWKLGLPLLALFGVVAVFLVPIFWQF